MIKFWVTKERQLGIQGTGANRGAIYDGMTYDTLNDKEFSIPGNKLNPIMKCERLTKPIITKDDIKNIILGGGQKYLSPERRFDAIIYYSSDLFD